MKYLIIIAAFIFMTSCCNHAPEEKVDEIAVHEAQANAVTLVNGEKWKVNFSVKEHLEKYDSYFK